MIEGDLDTITAIGTPKGTGALGIVRITGSLTQQILKSCLKSSHLNFEDSHRAFYGLWTDPLSKTQLDEVVAVYFAEGRGFTGEEAADIMCHGGPQVLDLVLNSVLDSGARLARPGEFTYRSVMNGKLGLTQAENVLHLIHSNSPKAAARALLNVRGALSQQLIKIESDIVFLLAHLEASIDFTTEDIQPVDSVEMKMKAQAVLRDIEDLLEGYSLNQSVNRGLRISFIGKPNSGKSSLVNALIGRNRSIVSAQPGTTRDLVESEMLCDGFLLKLVDTAGLRDTTDEVESIGVGYTFQEIESADLLVYVVDSSAGLQNEDSGIIRQIGKDRVVICFNKNDVHCDEAAETINKFGLSEFKFLPTSAVIAGGTQILKEFLAHNFIRNKMTDKSFDVSTARQYEGLKFSKDALLRAIEALEEKRSPEITSLELAETLSGIRQTLGKELKEDIMDTVFKEFCIGK